MSVVMSIDSPEIYEKVRSGPPLLIGGRVDVAGPRPAGGRREFRPIHRLGTTGVPA